jgi:hypothetical protein
MYLYMYIYDILADIDNQNHFQLLSFNINTFDFKTLKYCAANTMTTKAAEQSIYNKVNDTCPLTKHC